MAGRDQRGEPLVARRVGLPIVPGGDLERTDAAAAPLRRQVIYVGAQAIRGVEEGPQRARFVARALAEVGERLGEVGEALEAARARRYGGPQDRFAVGVEPGHQRRARPAIPREDARGGRHLEDRQLQRLLPDDAQLRVAGLGDATHGDAFLRRHKAESAGLGRIGDEIDDVGGIEIERSEDAAEALPARRGDHHQQHEQEHPRVAEQDLDGSARTWWPAPHFEHGFAPATLAGPQSEANGRGRGRYQRVACIPEARAQIPVVGAMRIVRVDEVNAADIIGTEAQLGRQRVPT